MSTAYTAVVQQSGEWWIGWVEEVPGMNSQGYTREELLDNLWDALEEALEINRSDARTATNGVTNAQRQELRRRVAEDDAHPEDVIPWEQVKAEARARAGR